ncbi:hypothetical protein LCGC14_0313650 [marine sediment metagenome]|uniref:Uncharacterized protein n=1 Tax=marine sediment metagenome TaxID=412755 RepID=A0A0F9WTE2_9ZZZZ
MVNEKKTLRLTASFDGQRWLVSLERYGIFGVGGTLPAALDGLSQVLLSTYEHLELNADKLVDHLSTRLEYLRTLVVSV